MPKEKIEEGSGLARYALLRGVPTAIAFDRVRVNGCDGAVFELLDAIASVDVAASPYTSASIFTRLRASSHSENQSVCAWLIGRAISRSIKA